LDRRAGSGTRAERFSQIALYFYAPAIAGQEGLRQSKESRAEGAAKSAKTEIVKVMAAPGRGEPCRLSLATRFSIKFAPMR
jgi:hypothetical protein